MINFPQLVVNSFVTGGLYLLAGTGLTLTYGLSRFPNFAYAEFVTLGAFTGYLFLRHPGQPVVPALLAAFVASGLLSVAAHALVFRPLQTRNAGLIHLMIASIGLGYVIRHTIGAVWGWSALSYQTLWQTYEVLTARLSALWLWLIVTAFLAGVALHLLLTRSRIGKAIRAIAANPELARATGIDTDRVTLFVWFLGAALAGTAGVFRAADTRLYPMLGWEILLPIFAATVLGGIGNFYGLIAAALILGLAENFGVVLLSTIGLSTEYRMAIAFLVLILVLVFRPKGLAR